MTVPPALAYSTVCVQRGGCFVKLDVVMSTVPGLRDCRDSVASVGVKTSLMVRSVCDLRRSQCFWYISSCQSSLLREMTRRIGWEAILDNWRWSETSRQVVSRVK